MSKTGFRAAAGFMAVFLVCIPELLPAITPPASVDQLYRQQVLYGHSTFSPIALDSTPELSSGAGPEGLKQRSVAKAAALSLLVPGAGQFYVGEKARAIPFFLVDVAGWAAYFGFRSQGSKREDEYRTYADQHWDTTGYFNFLENNLGITSRSDFDTVVTPYSRHDSVVDLNIPSGFIFSHHVPTREGGLLEKNLEYYESIGKYDQFFAGWDDPYLSRRTYLRMRADANNSFSKSKIGLVVSLADRLVAAVDAALAAQRFNRKLDKNHEIELSLRLVRYNGARMPKLSAIYRF